MESCDRLGRRRRPGQHRGLRSLFPHLPVGTRSRLIRVAMSSVAWERLDGLVATSSAPTVPRAYGELLEGWLRGVGAAKPATAAIDLSGERDVAAPGDQSDWQNWQIEKEVALLAAAGRMVRTGASLH